MAPVTQNLSDELAAALSIEDENLRAQALLNLAPQLGDPRLIEDVLSAIASLDSSSRIANDWTRGNAIAGLAPYLSDEQKRTAFLLIEDISDRGARNEALGRLGPHLSEEFRAKAISSVQADLNELSRLKGWVRLAPYLSSQLGMDAQLVAASMEVAYENLDKKMKSVTRSYGSLGWYFMDKFIQLQFSIPNMTGDQRSYYLGHLFGYAVGSDKPVPEQQLKQIQEQIERKLQDENIKPAELAEQAAALAPLRTQKFGVWRELSHSLIEKGAKQFSDDNPTLQKHLKDYQAFLGSSPRTIKRFANLYRFYSLTQLSRQSQGLPSCQPASLARWLVIMMRWPQLVRWLQWEGEFKLASGAAPDKAAALESEIAKTASFDEWVKRLKEAEPDHPEWLRDRTLFEFLKTAAAKDAALARAIETGVW